MCVITHTRKRFAQRWEAYYAVIAAIIFLGEYQTQQFIYFQFTCECLSELIQRKMNGAAIKIAIGIGTVFKGSPGGVVCDYTSLSFPNSRLKKRTMMAHNA